MFMMHTTVTAHNATVAIHSPQLPEPIGSYSQAVLTCNGQLLFVSGNISLKPDIKAATAEIMEKIHIILTAANMNCDNIVKTTIFLTDMANFTAVNEVYATFFGPNSVLPARETVAVKDLPKGALVEISVVAVKTNDTNKTDSMPLP
jgi:2-iminobutanoate/2-iminopropanoate deaminase